MPELAEAAEEQQVRGWRFQRFLAAGFSIDAARRLSEAGADHHEAERLLAAGCPLRLVYKLVRPL